MVLNSVRTTLEWTELADPQPGPGEIRVKVLACGVCRTDLHVIDGELPNPQVPIIPGHEIVGRIDAIGRSVQGLRIGERVGIPWLGRTDGTCPYCLMQRETLCDQPLFTGYTRNGGYATAAVADARFAFPLGEAGSDVALAPRRRAHPHTSHKMAASCGVCIHSSGRRHEPVLCARHRRNLGRRLG